MTIVIPVLNDVDALKILLPSLQGYREQGHEVIVVDGGSSDGSVTFASTGADRVLMTGTGRGRQMNLGAENASHPILLFLHADSVLPEAAPDDVVGAMADARRHWGRFDVKLDEPGFVFGMIATMMNLRSRFSGVATGDQGIFVRGSSFHAVGGFEDIPLMEDVALSKTLRRKSWPVCLSTKIITSARRWKNRGVVKTIFLMWWLRLAYFLGANTGELARIYYPPAASDKGRTRQGRQQDD